MPTAVSNLRQGVILGQDGSLGARAMVKNYQDIMSLSTTDTIRSFRVCGMNLFMVASAFSNTCREFQDDLLDFCLINEGTEKTIEDVYTGTANIGILALPEASIPSILATLRNRRIEYRDFFQVPIAITLRENHPLLDMVKEGQTALAIEKLREYPCVDYVGNDGQKALDTRYRSCINREKNDPGK
jgi:DNA-binding transcriptional LysR family regulator